MKKMEKDDLRLMRAVMQNYSAMRTLITRMAKSLVGDDGIRITTEYGMHIWLGAKEYIVISAEKDKETDKIEFFAQDVETKEYVTIRHWQYSVEDLYNLINCVDDMQRKMEEEENKEEE